MERINHATSAPNQNGTGKAGFTAGSVGTQVPPTQLTHTWCNQVQEEIATACERSGLTVDVADRNQLFKAMLMRQVRHAIVNATLETYAPLVGINAIASRNPNVGQAALLVSVGDGGSINTSTGGSSWTARTAAAAYAGSFRGAYADQDGMVIVGDTGEIQTSPDGVTWTHRAAAGGYASTFFAVTRSIGGTYLAVGGNGEIQTSGDGITWTARSNDGAIATPFYGASWSHEFSRYVIVGGSGEIQTSSNGVTWTHRSSGAASGVDLVAVTSPPIAIGNAGVYGPGPVVAVGTISGSVTEDMLYYSLDGGLTWARGTRPGSLTMISKFLGVSCSYFPGEDGILAAYYVAVGIEGRVVVSANGRGWMDSSRNFLQPFTHNCVHCDRNTGSVFFAGTANVFKRSQII